MMKKVMILTAPFGNGHLHVAKQLKKEMEKTGVLEVCLYDLFSEAYPFFTKFLKRYHLNQYKRGLSHASYKYFYYNSSHLLESKISYAYNHFGMKPLIKKIKQEQPDIIINTFPVNSSYFLSEQGIDIPVYTVITDYFANANWYHPNIKRHFVATTQVEGQLLKRGIKPEQILVTGIPVRDEFYQPLSETEITQIKARYHINQERVLLLVAGAKGVLPQFKNIVNFLKDLPNIKIIIVCGNNQKLKARMDKAFQGLPNIIIFGYVSEIHELMAISDLMVTKAGGITITEASHVSLPLILYHPIYGQELENAIYFSAYKGAKIARSKKEIVSQVKEILGNDDLLREMKQGIKKISIKDSAKIILESILADFGADHDGNYQDQEIK